MFSLEDGIFHTCSAAKPELYIILNSKVGAILIVCTIIIVEFFTGLEISVFAG